MNGMRRRMTRATTAASRAASWVDGERETGGIVCIGGQAQPTPNGYGQSLPRVIYFSMSASLELQRLRTMLLIRRFEERVYLQFTRPGQLIGGFCSLCSGQEAIAVGAVESYRRGVDAFVGTFRGHGWAIALGTSVRAVAAELYGRAAGCSKGRGGSLHLFDAAVGNLGTYY